MSGLLRFGVVRLVQNNCKQLLSANVPATQQSCNISGKSARGPCKVIKPKPYDYMNKNYGLFHAFFDKTSHRMDENSKIIVVEGPLAAGKSKFAKELADELEMHYFPEANMDAVYITPYGYDLRQLDPQMPESCKSFDVKNFLRTPNHRLVAQYQIRMLMVRYSQYIDALAHLFSTGQGVVLDRCVYSDMVFVEAMFRNGYLSKGARSVYYDLRKNTIPELLKPHLVVYLDVPVATVKERIKERNIDYEVNSKVLTDKYLTDLDQIYKQQYLKEISKHAELLVYDWSTYGESEVVVEDIERIDFDKYDKHDAKLKDWHFFTEWEWCETRMRFTNEKPDLMNFFNVPRFDVPELVRDGDDGKIWREVWYSAPGMAYTYGYNADVGDKGIATKSFLIKNNSPFGNVG